MPILSSKTKKKEPENIVLCKGVEIDREIFDKKENRIFTLMIKGVMLYLITMGAIGFYLSAFNVNYNYVVLNLVIFATAIIVAMLYYSRLIENVGYIGIFVVFAFVATLLRVYVNSGFYAIVNDTLEEASIYLDLDGIQQYAEQVQDRRLAITIAMCFVGFVTNILLNVIINRKMNYILSILLVMPILYIPLYFEHEPNIIYAVMLVAGFFLVFLMRGGKHFKAERSDTVLKKDKKGNISYVYDYKTVGEVLGLALVVILIGGIIFGAMFDKDTFDARYMDNKYKKSTMETTANLFTLGIAGLFNYYDSTGGLTGGILGGVSSIRLDYQTDLTVEITPYSYDSLYLKNFTGMSYIYGENRWEENLSVKETDYPLNIEGEALKQAYEAGDEFSAKGIMRVKNVAAPTSYYAPYYTDQSLSRVMPGKTVEYEYYPGFEMIDYSMPDNDIYKAYLSIPEGNYAVIDEFCKEQGFGGSPEEVINQVYYYYIKNVPYTIRPGATPRRKDFINYFLTDNKKGYCAHFASAATLIFRYYGIPARYVEGYAISFNQMVDGDMIQGAEYADYYDGYSEIGETALITVDATDADAHAWVEVYIEGKGWRVVDVTPPTTEDERVDFWDAFSRFMSNSSDDVDDEDVIDQDYEGFTINSKVLRGVVVVFIVIFDIFLVYIILRIVIPKVIFRVKYRKAGINDKLILTYQRNIRALEKKHKNLANCVNYKMQIEFLENEGIIKNKMSDEDRKEILSILDKAGFSNKDITKEEFDKVISLFRDKKKER